MQIIEAVSIYALTLLFQNPGSGLATTTAARTARLVWTTRAETSPPLDTSVSAALASKESCAVSGSEIKNNITSLAANL